MPHKINIIDKSKNGNIIRTLYRSSVMSIIIAAVAAMFGMLIDGIIIGKFLGTDCMAAYGLVSPLFNIMSAISGCMAAGAQVFCARHLGAGRLDRARQVFSACMLATIIISAGITAFLLIFCEPVCIGLGARESVSALLPLTKEYLYGISPGILPVLLLFIFNSLMRLDGDPNRIIWAVGAMTLFDIAGDLLNVFVIHAGMFGMGVTTALSYLLALFIMLLHFRKKDIIFRFSLRTVRGRDIGGIFKTGAPTATGSVTTMIRNLVLNHLMVGIGGTAAVAALSARNSANVLFGSILMGVGMTTTMIAGMAYGEEDRSSEKHLLKVSIKFAIGIGLILCIFVFFAAPWIVSIFSSGKEGSAEMSGYALHAMWIYAFGLPFYGINNVFINYLQGINKFKLANFISFVDNLLYVVLIALIFCPFISTDAVWIAYPAGEVLTILTVLFAAKIHSGRTDRRSEGLLFLPADFGASDENIFEDSMKTIEDLEETLERLRGFLQGRTSTDLELRVIVGIIKEMAGNVIRHGFTKDSKEHSVEVRILKKKEGWIIRIRDNCVAFDPVKRVEALKLEDTDHKTGIERVYARAREMRYFNVMQLNNLLIKL